MTYFLFTVDMLFSLIFFHNADVSIFAKTTAFLIDKSIVFTDQLDLATLNQ